MAVKSNPPREKNLYLRTDGTGEGVVSSENRREGVIPMNVWVKVVATEHSSQI